MTRRLIVSPQAEVQIDAIDSWWRTHRPASPDLFAEELANALSTIELAPEAGHRYLHRDVKGARRIPLRATRNHVYYVDMGDVVAILAVWGAIRKSGPDLSSTGQ